MTTLICWLLGAARPLNSRQKVSKALKRRIAKYNWLINKTVVTSSKSPGNSFPWSPWSVQIAILVVQIYLLRMDLNISGYSDNRSTPNKANPNRKYVPIIVFSYSLLTWTSQLDLIDGNRQECLKEINISQLQRRLKDDSSLTHQGTRYRQHLFRQKQKTRMWTVQNQLLQQK